LHRRAARSEFARALTDLLDGTRAYILAVIEHASRRIRIVGLTLLQCSARRLTDAGLLLRRHVGRSTMVTANLGNRLVKPLTELLFLSWDHCRSLLMSSQTWTEQSES
jgi:hypothetical protein